MKTKNEALNGLKAVVSCAEFLRLHLSGPSSSASYDGQVEPDPFIPSLPSLRIKLRRTRKSRGILAKNNNSMRALLLSIVLLCGSASVPVQASNEKHLKNARIVLSTMCLISVASKLYKLVHLIGQLRMDEDLDVDGGGALPAAGVVEPEVEEDGQEDPNSLWANFAGLRRYKAVAQCVQKIVYYGDLAIIGFLLAAG